MGDGADGCEEAVGAAVRGESETGGRHPAEDARPADHRQGCQVHLQTDQAAPPEDKGHGESVNDTDQRVDQSVISLKKNVIECNDLVSWLIVN